jgi:O-acetyl-ADP-ribose deacetylase (regulator of RNase III)
MANKINYKVGNILANVTSGVLLHSVNTLGVMGAGVARGIKSRYPDTFNTYAARCNDQFDASGSALVGTYIFTKENHGKLTIINAFGQTAIGRAGRLVSYDALDQIFSDIYSGPLDVVQTIDTVKIGAGLGGGSWPVIEQILLSRIPDGCIVNVWDFK